MQNRSMMFLLKQLPTCSLGDHFFTPRCPTFLPPFSSLTATFQSDCRRPKLEQNISKLFFRESRASCCEIGNSQTGIEINFDKNNYSDQIAATEKCKFEWIPIRTLGRRTRGALGGTAPNNVNAWTYEYTRPHHQR